MGGILRAAKKVAKGLVKTAGKTTKKASKTVTKNLGSSLKVGGGGKKPKMNAAERKAQREKVKNDKISAASNKINAQKDATLNTQKRNSAKKEAKVALRAERYAAKRQREKELFDARTAAKKSNIQNKQEAKNIRRLNKEEARKAAAMGRIERKKIKTQGHAAEEVAEELAQGGRRPGGGRGQGSGVVVNNGGGGSGLTEAMIVGSMINQDKGQSSSAPTESAPAEGGDTSKTAGGGVNIIVNTSDRYVNDARPASEKEKWPTSSQENSKKNSPGSAGSNGMILPGVTSGNSLNNTAK